MDYSYNDLNQLTEVAGFYWEYKYDLLNRLIEVTKNNNDVMIVIAKYAYDPEGFRVVKYNFLDGTQSDKTHYVFQGTEPIFEKRIGTGKIKSFVYALGKHLARVDGKIGDTEAKKYWYVTDHLGSIRAVSDSAGKVVWKADYLAFGTQFGKSADTDFEELHSFTGKEYDPDTGLHYYNARWYDSELGRFISEDPVGDPNNPNLYSYCGNNPVRGIDPTGCFDESYESDESDYTGYDQSMGTITAPDIGIVGDPTDESGESDYTGYRATDADLKAAGITKPDQKVQGVDPNKKPEGDTKNIADDKDKKKTEEINNVIDKPKPKDDPNKPQEKKEIKESKYKPVVEDKSKKNSNWEQRWKDAREIKDDKTRREAQGRLLEERFPGFKYDPNSPARARTQLDAWINRDTHEKVGITAGVFGYNISICYNITTGKIEVSKSYSPTSLGGLSFDYEVGEGSIGTEVGLSEYLSIGALWDFNDKGGTDYKGFDISIGWGYSSPVSLDIDIPKQCEPFPGQL